MSGVGSSLTDPASVPEPPPAASVVFGSQLPLAERYVRSLVGEGITRGLLGPREADRIWQRHLLNCAVVADLLPDGARVVDVGSGAGLPGVVLAIRRPDLRVDLVDSLARRTSYLDDIVEMLGLGPRVRVFRGRAEDAAIVAALGGTDWVTARAVAPLDRLVRWCVPLLRPGGRLLAMKGSSATSEVAKYRADLRRLGVSSVETVQCGAAVLDEVATVVVATRDSDKLHGGSRRGKDRS